MKKFFSSTGITHLSVLNNMSFVRCNKAISRCRKVGFFASFFQFPGNVPSLQCCSPSIHAAVGKADREVPCNPSTTGRQSVRSGAASYLKLHIRTVLSVRLPLFSLEKLPKQWEQGWHSKEVGFMLKAQSFRPGSNLHPVRRIFFCKTWQTKNFRLNSFKLSRNKNDLPGLFQVLHCSKLLPFSLPRSYFSWTGCDGGSLKTVFTVLKEQQTAALRTFKKWLMRLYGA